MLSELLTLGSRLTLVGGKGGVGKSTTSASLAVALADAGRPVRVISVDPAHSLGDALGVALGPEPLDLPGAPGLQALEVDAEREHARFLASRKGALLRLLERGTYLDTEDVQRLLDLALPGVDELAALFRLLEEAREPGRHLVVDTAPTGHTLRLLELPRLARGWLAALQAMEDKHRAVAQALTGGYQGDQATRMLEELELDLTELWALLTDPARTRFVLVTSPEPVVLAETGRARAALEALGIAPAGVVVNRSVGPVRPEAMGSGMVFVPPLHPEPTGLTGLRRFAAAAASEPLPPTPVTAPAAAPPIRVGAAFAPPADRRLYLVGGKGGVGKTTAACALGVWLAARRTGAVLLLSTDPAGSLGDVLQLEVGSGPVAVPGAGRLHAQQVDAAAEWAAFRDQYREHARQLFAGLLDGGLSASADQQVVERLIDLAPPGLDELVALLEVVDVTEDRPYDALILDTAPTGHLLRLLQMPQVALQWTHAVLRLLLKYREVIGLGELAERMLRMARALRRLREQLVDGDHTWTLVVARAEVLGVPETRRLLDSLRALGIQPGALLINRLLDEGNRPRAGVVKEAAGLLSLEVPPTVAAARDWPHGPAGVAELSRFLDEWRRILPGMEG